MALTVTGTATYSRFSLLVTQIRVLLSETTGASEETLTRISKGLAQPHYIEQVIVWGLLANGNIAAELHLSIDWREHALMIKAGGSDMQVPKTWRDSIAPTLREAIYTFNSALSLAALEVEWVVIYQTSFDHDLVNRTLGFTNAQHRVWEREPDRLDLGFGPLSEASLVIRLALD